MAAKSQTPRFPSVAASSLWAASLLAGLCVTVLLMQPGCSGVGGSTAKAEPAKATVVAFLEAIKRGDDAAARGLLTKLARLKTEELGISVAPPVADTATYSVRDAEVVGEAEDLVHVGTTWTDVDGDGFKTTENVVWVVRLDPEGWRVVGMAMRVFEDMAPLLLNFEDPEDMLSKQEMVAQEIKKRSQQAEKDAAARTARGASPAKVQ